ncbi:MAG: tyrosine recombinase [Candidatus Babeliales bacterium]|jgi:integrase/recombinase XerD
MSGAIDYFAQFQTYLLTEKRVSANTFAAYNQDIQQLDLYLKKNSVPVAVITKRHLQGFLKLFRDQKLKAKTLSRKISTLKLFFSFLQTQYKLNNAARSLVFPKVEKTLPHYLTEDEVEHLLDVAGNDESNKGVRNKVMLYMLYATGMRVSELMTVTVDQIHFDTGFIQLVGKGNKERSIPLPKHILEMLRFYCDHIYKKLLPKHLHGAEQSYLFATAYKKTLKPISRQSLWGILRKILQQAGITKQISPHSLRHSLATHLLKNGADIRSLQMLLGHESLATIQIYTHLEKSHVRKVYDEKHPRA